MIANCPYAKTVCHLVENWSGQQRLQHHQAVTKITDWWRNLNPVIYGQQSLSIRLGTWGRKDAEGYLTTKRETSSS